MHVCVEEKAMKYIRTVVLYCSVVLYLNNSIHMLNFPLREVYHKAMWTKLS